MCNVNSVVSCDKVAQSSYSEFFSIPLGVYGAGFFLALFVLLLWAYGNKVKRKAILTTYGLLVFLGCLGSLVLGLISSFLVKALCLICFGIYLCNFFQGFIFWRNRKDFWEHPFSFQRFIRVSLVVLVVFSFVLASYSLVKPKVGAHEKNFKTRSSKLSTNKVVPNKEPQKKIALATSSYVGNGEDYRKGSDEAKVVIHEFADFECPACQYMSKTLKEIQAELGSKTVLLVFRNFPLDNSCNPNIKIRLHDHACMAAKIARCGGKMGKFWDFHDAIFAKQNKLSEATLREEAAKLGLGKEAFDNCLQDKTIAAKLSSDLKSGVELGVSGTPSLFINGKIYNGEYSKHAITKAIRAEL